GPWAPKITCLQNWFLIGRIDTQDLFHPSLKGTAVVDFNAKHPAWSQSRSNINGSIIHNHIANINLVLLAPLEATHPPYHHPSSSTLDFDIMKNFSTGNTTSINDHSSDHNPVVFDINTNSNLSSGFKNINITNWKTCEPIHNSILGNPKMDSETEIDEEIQKFTCCLTTAINLSTRKKVISGPFRELPEEILSKIDSENSTKLFSSHHAKEKPTNCKEKSKRILKTMTIIDGRKQL
ncbi:hypothetical protein AVEN_158731-1, partial [Araneus ventricosus]